jgi:hypothetical protein
MDDVPVISNNRWPVWKKALAGLFSLAMIAATFSPITENWQDKPTDSFPLSYYPMFSQKRADKYQVHYMVGIDRKGDRHTIAYTFAGSGGFNQARRQLNKFVREKRADEMCNKVAGRVAKATNAPYSDIVEVRIVTGSFRFDDYFAGNTTPLKETVRAKAKVKRGES